MKELEQQNWLPSDIVCSNKWLWFFLIMAIMMARIEVRVSGAPAHLIAAN